MITSERYSTKINERLLFINLIKYTEDKNTYEYCREVETGLKFKFADDQAQAYKIILPEIRSRLYFISLNNGKGFTFNIDM